MRKPASCQGCPAEHDPCLSRGAGDNPAHIIVVGAAPSGFSIGKEQAFYGRYGRLFVKFLDQVRKSGKGAFDDLRIYTTYAALVGAYKPKAAHMQSCQVMLQRELSTVRGVGGRKPILVPLGPLALKAVGIKSTAINDAVGRKMTARVKLPTGDTTYDVVPLLSMENVSATPGTANVVMSALLKAVRLAMTDETAGAPPLEVLTKEYVFPKTIDELRELVDEIIAYTDDKYNADNWPIALDTETNTLTPFLESANAKTLMLSVAWAPKKAATILLDHAEAPYDVAEAWEQVRRLLECPKPKIFHNWKFDYQFLEHINGITVNHVAWDTMLGEHYLDEDKVGFYSLKKLTPTYAPAYTGYEETLQAALRGEKDDTIHLSDADIASVARPESRDEEAWNSLVAAVHTRLRLKKIVAAKRTKSEKEEYKTAGKDVKRLRAELRIVGAAKKKKKSGGSGDGGFSGIALDTILQYAAVDADVTRIIFLAQSRRLRKTNLWEECVSVMKKQYLPGSYTLSDMEYRGFTIDTEHLAKLNIDITARVEETAQFVAANFDATINLNSPQQVAELMVKLDYEHLEGVEPGTTGQKSLDAYMEHYPSSDPRHQFARALLRYRKCTKALSTYVKPYLEYAAHDGRIHSRLNLHGTATGRLSNSDPNLQQVTKIAAREVRKNPETGKTEVVFPGFGIKKLFVPSRPGHVIVNCDISGAELRVYTAYSRDQLMTDALNSGTDVHSLVTSKVYKIPYDEVMARKNAGDPEIHQFRTNCKRVVFGVFYGAGPHTISEQIGATYDEAKELQEFMFAEFPALLGYVNDTTNQVRDRQMVKTFFGRCRRFRMAHMTNAHFQKAKREAVNFLIQSTSSDLVLSQMCEMSDNFHVIGARMLLTVHDSMVFEMPEDVVNLETTVTVDDDGNEKKHLVDTKGDLHDFLDYWIVARIRAKYPWLPVSFAYDLEIGPNYGAVKEVGRGTPSKIPNTPT